MGQAWSPAFPLVLPTIALERGASSLDPRPLQGLAIPSQGGKEALDPIYPLCARRTLTTKQIRPVGKAQTWSSLGCFILRLPAPKTGLGSLLKTRAPPLLPRELAVHPSSPPFPSWGLVFFSFSHSPYTPLQLPSLPPPPPQ